MPGFLRLPRAVSGAFVLLFFLLSVHGSRIRPAEAIANCEVGDLSFDGEEKAFLKIINDYRASYGLSALTVSANLNRSASWMAQDLTKGYFSHTDSLGRLSQNRIADCGGSVYSGENLGAGPGIVTGYAAFDLWRTSPGHNANMLYADYKQIGIARVYAPGSYYSYYWVTTFDTIDDGTRMVGTSLYDPAPGSNITSESVVFRWNPSVGVYEYWLDVGSWPGGNDIYSSTAGMALGALVMHLPRDGRYLYVRVSMRTANGWQYEDYIYTAPYWQ